MKCRLAESHDHNWRISTCTYQLPTTALGSSAAILQYRVMGAYSREVRENESRNPELDAGRVISMPGEVNSDRITTSHDLIGVNESRTGV